jgi:hypothetical protein
MNAEWRQMIERSLWPPAILAWLYDFGRTDASDLQYRLSQQLGNQQAYYDAAIAELIASDEIEVSDGVVGLTDKGRRVSAHAACLNSIYGRN